MPRVILTVQSMSNMLLHYCISGCAIASYSNATDFCSWYKITRTLICSELVAASKRFPGQSALIRHREPLELNQQASRFSLALQVARKRGWTCSFVQLMMSLFESAQGRAELPKVAVSRFFWEGSASTCTGLTVTGWDGSLQRAPHPFLQWGFIKLLREKRIGLKRKLMGIRRGSASSTGLCQPRLGVQHGHLILRDLVYQVHFLITMFSTNHWFSSPDPNYPSLEAAHRSITLRSSVV